MVVLQIRLSGSASLRHFYVIHDEKEPLVSYLPEVQRTHGTHIATLSGVLS
jgi:hypothetical protein